MARVARLVVLSLVLVGSVLVPKALTHSAHGQAGCSAASLSGPYGFVGSGILAGAPIAFVGTFVFDGQGSATASFVVNVAGSIDDIDGVTGTYQVDGPCAGAMVIKTVHNKPSVTHYHDIEMVVVDGGKEILFTIGGPKDSASADPPPGEVLSGVFKRL